jgi:hypothetical protein
MNDFCFHAAVDEVVGRWFLIVTGQSRRKFYVWANLLVAALIYSNAKRHSKVSPLEVQSHLHSLAQMQHRFFVQLGHLLSKCQSFAVCDLSVEAR